MTDNVRDVRERTRRKYTYRTGAAQVAQTRQSRPLNLEDRQRQARNRIIQARRNKLLSDIQREKDPDQLKKKMDQARREGLEKQMLAQDAERLKKMENARQRIQEDIKHLTEQKASATTKDAMIEIQAGRSQNGMEMMASAGRDGAVGNNIADVSTDLARNAKVLAKETGRHFDSVMNKMLREHSKPADTIHAQKAKDKSDQNLEKSQTKKSTQQQMTEQLILEQRMRMRQHTR